MRRRKKFLSLVSVLLLAALQLHGLVHLFDGEGPGHACAACVETLSQSSLGAAEPVQAAPAALGFALLPACITFSAPRFRGFPPSLRAPPAFS